MKTWQRTGTQGLLKHRGGGYYARFFPYGKTKFVPLGTTVLEDARKLFAKEKKLFEDMASMPS